MGLGGGVGVGGGGGAARAGGGGGRPQAGGALEEQREGVTGGWQKACPLTGP